MEHERNERVLSRNASQGERVIRLIVALILFAYTWFGPAFGSLLFASVGVYVMLTSLTGWCLANYVLKIRA